MRSTKLIVPLALILSAFSLSGEEKEKENFEELCGYKDVTVLKVKANEIRIMHESGVAALRFVQLSPEMRAHFGMTLEGAVTETLNEIEEVLKKEAARRRKALLESEGVKLHGNVFSVSSVGVLLDDVSFSSLKKEQVKRRRVVKFGGPTGLHPDRPYQYRSWIDTEWVYKWKTHKGLVFVHCDTKGIAKNEFIKRTVYPYPLPFTYVTVGGGKNSVKAFTTDGEEFLDLIIPEE